MRLFAIGLAACVALGLSAQSGGIRADDKAKQAKTDPVKELATIQSEWSNAQQAFSKAYQEAKTDDERRQVLKDKRPKPDAFADRCLKLAEANPDSPVYMEALAWVLANAGRTPAAKTALPKLKEKLAAITDLSALRKILIGMQPSALMEAAPLVAEKAKKNLDDPQAAPLLIWVASATLYSGNSAVFSKLYNDIVDLIMDRFVERDDLAELADWLAMDDDPAWAEKHLRRLRDKNPSEVVKTHAAYGLAAVLKNKDETSQPEAEKLFESVIASANASKGDLAEKAKKELDEMKVRGIGKPAPEISGSDLDGKAFKLSDYKGKVVLLDFWGFW
jgi:hypothetical protein